MMHVSSTLGAKSYEFTKLNPSCWHTTVFKRAWKHVVGQIAMHVLASYHPFSTPGKIQVYGNVWSFFAGGKKSGKYIILWEPFSLKYILLQHSKKEIKCFN